MVTKVVRTIEEPIPSEALTFGFSGSTLALFDEQQPSQGAKTISLHDVKTGTRKGQIALAIPAALTIQRARGIGPVKKGELKDIEGQISVGDGFISINGYYYTNGYLALYHDLRP